MSRSGEQLRGLGGWCASDDLLLNVIDSGEISPVGVGSLGNWNSWRLVIKNSGLGRPEDEDRVRECSLDEPVIEPQFWERAGLIRWDKTMSGTEGERDPEFRRLFSSRAAMRLALGRMKDGEGN